MNTILYRATLERLQSHAREALARIQSLLQSHPVPEGAVEQLVEQSLLLVQYEGAIHSLQTYMKPAAEPAPGPRDAAPTEPRDTPVVDLGQHPPSPRDEPLTVTPEISPTYRESLRNQFGDEPLLPEPEPAPAEEEPPPYPHPTKYGEWQDEDE
jgi:hypothetical protein